MLHLVKLFVRVSLCMLTFTKRKQT